MADTVANFYRIQKAIDYLSTHFKEQPSLETIAGQVNMSPFHFHRIFTDWVGISPKKFSQFLTLDFLKEQLRQTQNMIDAAEQAGLSSQSRVHDLFITLEGMSPQQYKTGGQGLTIHYGYHSSPFGLCFLALIGKKICRLEFIDIDKQQSQFVHFARYWSQAHLIEKPAFTEPFIQQIFEPHQVKPGQLALLVRATEFQLKVWQALLQIPYGCVSSYQQIAAEIGHPGTARAVSNAASLNPIVYLIPCHRIIAKTGRLNSHHYGWVRKQAMIGWEFSQGQDSKIQIVDSTGPDDFCST